MGDCEETDFCWKSWTATPGKGKRKKDSKKDRKRLKHKNNITMKADENIQKKKKMKSSKFKEAMEGRKDKKKGKTTKKNRLALGLDGSFLSTQGSGAQANPTVKPVPGNPRSSEEPKPDQDGKKKTRNKKIVAFESSPAYVRVKRPELVSWSQQSQSCWRVRVTGHSQGEMQDNESQCSEEVNSQDLFITQKTFRASPRELSSGDASDKALPTSPPVSTPQDELHASMAWIKQHLEGSYDRPRDSHFHQHHRQTSEHVQKPKTDQEEEEEEEERLIKAHQNPKKKKPSFQTKTEFNTNPTEEKNVSRPAHTTPRELNPSLQGSKRQSRPLSQQCPSCLSDEPSVLPSVSTESTSTQTENFFTTQLSSYLNFCRESRATLRPEDLKPLDLSLPQRARKDFGLCLSAKTSSLSGETKEPNLHPSCSLHKKDVEVKREPCGQHPCSVSTRGQSEARRAQSEPKTADTTTSSEDERPSRIGKLDLAQVRAVQMRLNESFFFKAKGEGQSPRPESPLMKLAQSRQERSRKGH